MADAETLVEFGERLGRIEKTVNSYELVLHRILGILEVLNEKADAVLEAAVKPPGKSPVQETLKQILAALEAQAASLETLPEAIGRTIRDELQKDFDAEADFETEEAGPDSFSKPQ